MKDLQSLYNDSRNKLINLGLNLGEVTTVETNKRFVRVWGRCHRNNDGTFKIEINPKILQDTVPDKSIENTIMHELIHTIDGCWSHTGKWKEMARYVNSNLNQTISRTTSPKQFNLERIETRTYNINYKNFMLECIDCGYRFTRHKMCDSIKHPERYRCGRCNGKLKRIY